MMGAPALAGNGSALSHGCEVHSPVTYGVCALHDSRRRLGNRRSRLRPDWNPIRPKAELPLEPVCLSGLFPQHQAVELEDS